MTKTALALRSIDGISRNPAAPGSPEFEQTASHMAREFSEATTEIARLVRALHAQTERLDTAFRTDMYSRFSIDLKYHGHQYNLDGKGAADLVKAMERWAWEVLVDALGIEHMTHDKLITIHHNADWSGEVIVIARSPETESGHRETRLPGSAVLSGDYDRPKEWIDCPLTERELRRATALAMYAYVTAEAIEAVEQIDVPGVL